MLKYDYKIKGYRMRNGQLEKNPVLSYGQERKVNEGFIDFLVHLTMLICKEQKQIIVSDIEDDDGEY